MIKKFTLLIAILFSSGLFAETTQKKTVCLNMIVKNERDVIEKCLGSVRRMIDYWVIFDTGSNDGTQEIIKNYLKDIPGELHQSNWVNFEHNRNEALKAAKGKADYLLLIDADEVLQYSEDFTLPALDLDTYHIIVRQLGAADVKRIGMIKSSLDWTWKGVLHEVLVSKEARSVGLLKGVMNICNASIGARTKDPSKYLKDALLLEKALVDEPTNSRYAFYMAQGYLNAEKYLDAIKAFEKRISMPSEDVQETYLAHYNKGMSHEKMGDFEGALKSYFKAFELRPIRAEPLFRTAVIYRKQGNYLLGYLLSKYALTIPYPAQDLCVEYLTYDHALLIEFANCTLLTGRFQEGHQACCKLLANPNLPADIKPQVVSNCELAVKQLSQLTMQNPSL